MKDVTNCTLDFQYFLILLFVIIFVTIFDLQFVIIFTPCDYFHMCIGKQMFSCVYVCIYLYFMCVIYVWVCIDCSIFLFIKNTNTSLADQFSFQIDSCQKIVMLNPFAPNAPFLYSMKTSENRFHGLEKGCIGSEWVKLFSQSFSLVALTSNCVRLSVEVL